jgi:AcrR family transcriptional regulator
VTNSQASAPAATIGEVDGDPRPAAVRAGTARAGAQEPRTRIVAAMIELVGEQGYASTSVADVIARAGASRRTFYEYFANNQACFMDAAEDIAARWLDRVALAVDQAAAAGEDQVAAYVDGLFQATLASPSELRLLAAELPAAMEAGLELRRFAFAELGHTLSQALGTGSAPRASSSKRAGTPDASLIPRVLTGAIVRIAYARVLRGARARRPARGKLLALSARVADWATT